MPPASPHSTTESQAKNPPPVKAGGDTLYVNLGDVEAIRLCYGDDGQPTGRLVHFRSGRTESITPDQELSFVLAAAFDTPTTSGPQTEDRA